MKRLFIVQSALRTIFLSILITSFTLKSTDNLMQKKIYNTHLPTLNEKAMTTDTTFNVVCTRVFDAPIATVWKAWSDGNEVMKWWGPTGFTSPLCKMDFREGGSTLVCMRAPKEFGGMDMYNTWNYQKIVPMERIEYIFVFCDKDGNKLDPAAMGLPPGIPKEVPHVVTFKALSNNKTEMSVTEYGYASEQTVAISKAGMEQCIDKMAASFKSR